MVDEFIYQFQSFSQYRGKLAQKSPHELELLKKCDGVWDLQGVLHYLQGLIDKSGVVRELATDGEFPRPSVCHPPPAPVCNPLPSSQPDVPCLQFQSPS